MKIDKPKEEDLDNAVEDMPVGTYFKDKGSCIMQLVEHNGGLRMLFILGGNVGQRVPTSNPFIEEFSPYELTEKDKIGKIKHKLKGLYGEN